MQLWYGTIYIKVDIVSVSATNAIVAVVGWLLLVLMLYDALEICWYDVLVVCGDVVDIGKLLL